MSSSPCDFSESFFGPVLHLVEVTFECLSPLSVGGGEGSKMVDVLLMRDANGLPTIPASSLAGALRHAWSRYATEVFGETAKTEEALFGFLKANQNEGQSARLQFGWGRIHDSKDRPISTLDLKRAVKLADDPVLVGLVDSEAPLKRNHARHNHRGVVADRGFFNRAAVPSGARFSFQVSMWGSSNAEACRNDRSALEQLVALIDCPDFRLGGAGARGYGRVLRRRTHYKCFDLKQGNDDGSDKCVEHARTVAPSSIRAALRETGQASSEFSGTFSPPAFEAQVHRFEGNVSPVGAWRVGSGNISFLEGREAQDQIDADALKPADLLVLTEPWIDWSKAIGCFRAEDGAALHPIQDSEADDRIVNLVIPGSALRGPVAHRAHFHYNRLCGRFIPDWSEKDEGDVTAAIDQAAERDDELERLFGGVKRGGSSSVEYEANGRASSILFDDVVAKVPLAALRQAMTQIDHIALDRFTQGPINGALFTEEVVWNWPRHRDGAEPDQRNGFEIKITIREMPGAPVTRNLKQALALAIDDLVEGRLAIGAKSHGFLKGKMSGSLKEWVDKNDA